MPLGEKTKAAWPLRAATLKQQGMITRRSSHVVSGKLVWSQLNSYLIQAPILCIPDGVSISANTFLASAWPDTALSRHCVNNTEWVLASCEKQSKEKWRDLTLLSFNNQKNSTDKILHVIQKWIKHKYRICSNNPHVPISAHPSYFEAINHKIVNHLHRSIHETNIFRSMWLGINLKMTKILNFRVLATNIETNKRPPEITNLSALDAYLEWMRYFQVVQVGGYTKVNRSDK